MKKVLILVILVMTVFAEENGKLCNLKNSFVIDNNDENICQCSSENSSPWGVPILKILCIDKNLEDENFLNTTLPIGTTNLDISFNNLTVVPPLNGSNLQQLSLTHNFISKLDDKQFVNTENVELIDLSHNKIAIISSSAFAGLSKIRKIDLTGNEIKQIPQNTFSGLFHLDHLILSMNPLNEFFTLKDNDLFMNLGVPTKLRILEINFANLSEIDLTRGVGLEEIQLVGNNLSTIQQLPQSVKILDVSMMQAIKILSPKTLPHLHSLTTFYMRDMPNLVKIDEYAFYGFPHLQHISLQGSKNLTTFHSLAFGGNVVLNETDTMLEVLNLEGTRLKTLNSSLKFAFENLKILELKGNPLDCDCEVAWLKDLDIETQAECSLPFDLKGQLLSQVDDDLLECIGSSSWVAKTFNAFLVIILIILSCIAMYFIIQAIKPKQVQLRKVGQNSPYARVTIEPNHAENAFTI